MSDRDAFLRAIADNPEDTTARGAFADWLEEHGEPVIAAAMRSVSTFDRGNLSAAFRFLRKIGFFAKQRYLCCSGCAWAAISGLPEKMKRPPRKAVFYHRQDAEDLDDGNDFHLSYGTVGYEKHDASATREIGREIVTALALFGIGTEWDCSPGMRIVVKTETLDR